ncbi:MAG: type II toxin-antitoxin system RelE/ParE family toxin [bacterium]
MIVREAEKEYLSLPGQVRNIFKTKLLALQKQPRPRGSQKLHTTNTYRIRTGNYRALYSIDDHKRSVLVLSIGHRKEIYR